MFQAFALHLSAFSVIYQCIIFFTTIDNLHDVVKIRIDIDIKLSREQKKLPIVLTKNEIQSIMGSIKNEKHKFIISLAYGSGLRVSDVINLHV